MLRQSSPGSSRIQVEDDEAVSALVGGIDEVSDPGAVVEIEADVVEVRVWVVDGRGKSVRPGDLVRSQVDRDQFGAPDGGIGHGAIDGRPSGVDHPEGVARDVECLHGDEVVGQSHASHGIRGEVGKPAGRRVQGLVRVRLLCCRPGHHAERVGVVAPSVADELS